MSAAGFARLKNDVDLVAALRELHPEEDTDVDALGWKEAVRDIQILQAMSPEVTIIGIVRHGHGTAPMFVDGLYGSTDVPFRLIYADIASPPHVERYLAKCAREREGFTHLRFDDFVSRQSARLSALEQVETPWVALIDNNIVCEPGWLPRLLATARETGAAIISPTIALQGGSIHYSGGRIVRKRSLRTLGLGFTYRPQDAGAPARSQLGDLPMRPMDVDFVESHCSLNATEVLRLPGVMEPEMHNAFTLCHASYKAKREYGRRIVFEPSAVASIVPIGFGYDLPWLCLEYMRRDRLELAYAHQRRLLGPGPATDVSVGFFWHARHFRYLLLGMLESGRLRSEELFSLADVPAEILGYDDPVPADADERIRAEVIPFIRERYPECLEIAQRWLDFRHNKWLSLLKMALDAGLNG